MFANAIETHELTLKFGQFTAVDGVSLIVREGARHAIIGPNGAGKSSLVAALTGALPATSGQVRIHGTDVSRLSQTQRVHAGLARTFQINQLFTGLSVVDNIRLALFERDRTSRVFWRSAATYSATTEEAHALLDLVDMKPLADRPIASLAYGQQRLVEIAIALAVRPRVLILDEPAAGVPSTQSQLIFERISALPKEVTLIFIEHDMNLVFRFAERISVLVSGQLLTEGTPDEIRSDALVRRVYLGH
ncbi:ABC-type branched-subunit amino acid transport system ATPase component OS=Castellaniella defragrans OX=75697 GN=HNR28_001879 PE=4 SV=1 [Castellaniella defragrans]